MSKIIDITKLTLEEAKALLGNGTSVQDLISVVEMSTTEYSSNTGKFEPNQELINKQLYEIPVEFIENNLQLLITSGYKSNEVLERITWDLYGLNDPLSLIMKLIDDHKADASKLSYISSDLNINSIEFLLSRGLKGDALLMPAFQNNDKEKQKELLDLAFKHGASSSSFKSVCAALENLNEDVFEMLITKHKVSAQDLLSLVVRASTSQYNQANQKHETNQELIRKQDDLVQFCLTEGAKLKDAFKNVNEIPVNFIENNLQLLITNECKPTEILRHIISNQNGLNDPLSLIMKLIDDHKADASKLSYISSDLNINSIELMLSRGLKGDALLMPAFQNNDKEKQKELLDLAFKHGASSSSFKSVCAALENLNEDVFEMLITKHKVPAQDLLNLVVHAKTTQYNQTTQKHETNQELITKLSNLQNFLISQGADLNLVQIDGSRGDVNTLFRNAGLIIEASSLGDNTLDILLSRTYILQREHVDKEYTDKIITCYQDLLKAPESKKILDFLAFKIRNGDDSKIIFASNLSDRDWSHYDSYGNYVAICSNDAKRVSTTIHEFSHCAIDKVFANDSLPYLATQESYSQQVKKSLEQQHQEYIKAAVEPMKLALQMISRAENDKTEIDSSEEFAVYLKTQTLLPLWYLKDHYQDWLTSKATLQFEELREIALTVIKILYTDIEEQNKHIIGIRKDPIIELEHLESVRLNLEKTLNISKSQSIFLIRLAEEVYRGDQKDREHEHIVRYIEFLAQHNEGKLEDPEIMKSYSKLKEYWNKYIFPKMEEIMGSPFSIDQGPDRTNEDEVSISGGSSVSVGTGA